MRILTPGNKLALIRPWVALATSRAPGPEFEAALVIGAAIDNAEADLLAPDRTALLERARELHCLRSNDEIEVDEDAVFSRGDEGVWVQGWLFVHNAELPGYVEPGEETDA